MPNTDVIVISDEGSTEHSDDDDTASTSDPEPTSESAEVDLLGAENNLEDHRAEHRACSSQGTTITNLTADDACDDEAHASAPISNECIICMSTWTTSGPHRTVSLKCGHLFGMSCLKDWIKRSKVCPNCKAVAKPADIRPVYAINLTAVDDSDLQSALRQRDAERAKVVQLEKQNQFLRQNLLRLESKLSEWVPPVLAGYPLRCTLSLQICSEKSVRVGASSWSHPSMVYVSHAQEGRFGFSKWDLCNTNVKVFNPVQSGPVRDLKVQCRSGSKDFLLSTGLDKTLRLFSMESKSTEVSMDLPSPAWSCSFDGVRENIVYVGYGNRSTIGIYDFRNPSQCLGELSDAAMGRTGFGVHSLHHVQVENSNVLVGGSLANPFLVCTDNSTDCFSVCDSFQCISLFKGGKTCTSVDFNHENNKLVMSWRTDEKMNHVVGSLDFTPCTDDETVSHIPAFNHIAEFESAMHMNLNRSRCLVRNGQTIFVTGGDTDGAACIRTVSEGGNVSVVQTLAVETGAKVMDSFTVGDDGNIVVLTDMKGHLWA
ncbi:RING finger and WD repeat domain-containing protein 3 [Entophlyctis sp. JEL0112]|nr:RING finger and WD repeat domain-containing protein 3 [Entophlyctis sp. JEL0112]